MFLKYFSVSHFSSVCVCLILYILKKSYHPTFKIIVRKVRKVKEKNMLVACMRLESIPV
jgi:hypothetical protein